MQDDDLIKRSLATRYAFLTGRKVYLPRKQGEKFMEVIALDKLWGRVVKDGSDLEELAHDLSSRPVLRNNSVEVEVDVDADVIHGGAS